MDGGRELSRRSYLLAGGWCWNPKPLCLKDLEAVGLRRAAIRRASIVQRREGMYRLCIAPRGKNEAAYMLLGGQTVVDKHPCHG